MVIDMLNCTVYGLLQVCFRGRNVMMGYLNQADKTREVIDEDGWAHSGDLGKFDQVRYFNSLCVCMAWN